MKLQNNISRVIFICIMLMGMEAALFAAKNCPVDLSYQQIYDDLWPNEVDAIQHQFEWQEIVLFAAMKELEFAKDFTIPTKPVFPETEADPRSNVYGYHRDGTLALKGGPKKSYNREFKKFLLRYHVAFEGKYPTGDPQDPVFTQPLAFLTPKVVKNIYKHNIPYFVERGFDIQEDDTFTKFQDQYIWTFPAGQNQAFGAPAYVALRLVWEEKDGNHRKKLKCEHSDIPAFVDLHATANTTFNEQFILDTFKRNKTRRKNGYGYPIRIPVTTNFCRFQNLYNVEPIAFYDQNFRVLTVHVPNTDSTEHFLTRRVINTGNPDLNIDYIEHLAGFDGSFKVFGLDKSDQLVPSGPKNAQLLAQVSEGVRIRSQVVQNPENGGQPEFFEYTNPIRAPVLDVTTLNYTGVVAGRMNDKSGRYDCYGVPVPILNAYEIFLDPIDVPHENENGRHFARGDNPLTRVVEKYSSIGSTTLYDFEVWNLAAVRLPFDVLKGKTSFPENVSTTAIPTDVSGADTFITVNVHEFTHQAQFASGSALFLPSEGMAVGIELDTHASGETFLPLRAGTFTTRHIRTTRGEFTAMRPDAFGLSTYGMGIWWKYLQDQFDFNNQVMRRTMDILSSDTMGPLLRKNHFPDSITGNPVNDVGGSVALDRALRDLFGKNIKDVWNDYSISITLFRNNTSIPPQWRHYFPYWIYNSDYSGYDKIVAATAPFGLQAFANWWEQMDENEVIPAAYNTPYTGETFIRTLPEHFETDALTLRTYAFNVTRPNEGGPSTINVTVPQGEWRVTLVQFTSDGTPVGSFIADGPHTLIGGGSNNTLTLNVAGHNPAFSETGNIRLICVNVTFNGNGKSLDEYFTEETPNGRIIIDAPVAKGLAKKQQKK
jgi:hypothetical protein